MNKKNGIALLGTGGAAFALGWFLGTNHSTDRITQKDHGSSRIVEKPVRSSPPGASSGGQVEPEPDKTAVDAAFLNPASEEDRAAIREAVHQALEKDGGYPARMSAVCAALAKLTPENAAEFARAFDESWLNGHDFATERTLFFFRLGEVTGSDGLGHLAGMKEISSGDKDRVIEGWAGVDADAATRWINALPNDKVPEGFIDSAFWGAGMRKPEYALEVFKLQDERRQKDTFEALVRINRLRGGNQAVTELARTLLESPEPAMQQWGQRTLLKARDIQRKQSPEALQRWMDSLPESSRALLAPQAP